MKTLNMIYINYFQNLSLSGEIMVTYFIDCSFEILFSLPKDLESEKRPTTDNETHIGM